MQCIYTKRKLHFTTNEHLLSSQIEIVLDKVRGVLLHRKSVQRWKRRVSIIVKLKIALLACYFTVATSYVAEWTRLYLFGMNSEELNRTYDEPANKPSQTSSLFGEEQRHKFGPAHIDLT